MNPVRVSDSPVLSQALLQRQPRVLQRPYAPKQTEETMITSSLDDLREQAWRAGFASGETAGREEGQRQGIEQGRQRGLEEGRAEGERQSAQQVRERLEAELETMNAAWRQREEQLLQLLQSIPAQLARRLEDAEDDMVALAHAAVLRVLGTAFQGSEGVRLAVRRQLDELGQRQPLALHLHPDDMCLLRDDILASLAAQGVACAADPRVVLGGCIIDTHAGSLDARLETQLQAFTELLLRIRAQADSTAAP